MQRRTFIAAMVGSSFLVGCASPARQQLRRSRFAPNPDQVALNGWVKVGRDSTITVVMGKSDMGQGVHTALMMLVAEDMDANWAQMRWENAPIDPLYGNVAAMADGVPFRPDDQGSLARSVRWVMRNVMRQMGLMMTGGSSSVKDMWEPLREAAAITRATLVHTAAQHWGVMPAKVRVESGVFKGPNQTLQLGEVVALMGDAPKPATNYRLKATSEFKLIGQPQTRDDVPAKSNGTALFGMDVRPPAWLAVCGLALRPGAWRRGGQRQRGRRPLGERCARRGRRTAFARRQRCRGRGGQQHVGSYARCACFGGDVQRRCHEQRVHAAAHANAQQSPG